MNQSERRIYLIRELLREEPRYRRIAVPGDGQGQRELLRSLMNIRLPRPMAQETLLLQDEYLQARAAEKGIVSLDEIPPAEGVISVWQGDITRLAADAIVNAANSQMLGCFQPCHSCIDNCIHTFAGVQLRTECGRRMDELRRRYGRSYEQPTAEPMLTDAYNLPARKIVHIVGPIVYDRVTPELERELAACYSNTLDLCLENGLRSVAFCCISTGVFRFPKQKAAEIAVQTVRRWLAGHEGAMERVIFNVFNDKDRERYEQILHSA